MKTLQEIKRYLSENSKCKESYSIDGDYIIWHFCYWIYEISPLNLSPKMIYHKAREKQAFYFRQLNSTNMILDSQTLQIYQYRFDVFSEICDFIAREE